MTNSTKKRSRPAITLGGIVLVVVLVVSAVFIWQQRGDSGSRADIATSVAEPTSFSPASPSASTTILSADELRKSQCEGLWGVLSSHAAGADLTIDGWRSIDWSGRTPERLVMRVSNSGECVASFVFQWMDEGDRVLRDTPDPYDNSWTSRDRWCSLIEQQLEAARVAYRVWSNWPGCHFKTTLLPL